MKHLIAPALAVAMFAAPAMGQEAAKPGPQHARMAYFAGSWQFEGEAKDSPMGPGGKLTGADTCEWFAGGFQLICRGDATGPRGPAKTGSVWAWDPSQNHYTYFGHSSMGDAFFVTGNVAGNVWTWSADFPTPAGSVKMRATITEEPPSAYAFKLEMSADGTSWMVVEEGRATKRGR
jgi:hypothetical protein